MTNCTFARIHWLTSMIVGVAVALAACGAKPPKPVALPALPTIPATRVYVGDCVFRPEGEAFFAPLLGAILPNLISKGINLFGNTLEAAAKEQTVTATAHTNFELQADRIPRCIQVVRGAFAPSADDFDHNNPGWATGSPFADVIGILKTRRIYLMAKPEFFFEGTFRRATNGTAFAIAPVAAAFETPLESRALRGDATRHVKIAFAFHAPGKSATDAATPTTDLILGKMTPGQFTRFEVCPPPRPSSAGGAIPPVAGGAPVTAPTPAPTPTPKPGSTTTAACNAESLWFAMAPTDTPLPLSATTVVSETQGASAFLAFVAEVFKESKDELETVAKQTLIESEREKARAAQQKAADDLADEFDKTVTEVIGALDACSKDGSVTKASDARTKQRAANRAALSAGQSAPFASALLVPLTQSEGDTKTACAAALKHIKETSS
jgi:hypothetical protein